MTTEITAPITINETTIGAPATVQQPAISAPVGVQVPEITVPVDIQAPSIAAPVSVQQPAITAPVTVGGVTGIGSPIPSGTPGSVLFVGSDVELSQDNENLFWDAQNKRLGVGTAAPAYAVDVKGATAAGGIGTQAGLNFDLVDDPTGAIVGTPVPGGAVDAGTHYYQVKFVTAIGETHGGAYSGAVVADAVNNAVQLSNIPVSPDPRVIARKLYRSKVGGATDTGFLLATINDNVTTTYLDIKTDASLTGNLYLAAYAPNTTSNQVTIDGVRSMMIDQNRTLLGRDTGLNLNGDSFVTVFGAQNFKNSATSPHNIICFGSRNLGGLTTGSNNHVFGELSGAQLNTGSYNCIFGTQSLRYGTTSSQNTVMGYAALLGGNGYVNHYNSAFGYKAGRGLTQGGNSNTFLGYNAGYNASQKVNATASMALGYNTYTTADYQHVYGGSAIIQHLFQAGDVGIGIAPGTAPTAKLDINSDKFRLRTAKTPSTATDTGNAGDVCWDSNYIYVCVATNTWKRAALSTW